MTKKQTLIKRLNELRTQANMPPYEPAKVKMSVEELETLIYQHETPHEDVRDKEAPPTIAQLLQRLNVLRERAGDKPVKRSRQPLEVAIKLAEAKASRKAAMSTGATKIAEGANTKRSHTSLHNNPLIPAMKRMRKQQERASMREAKDTARKIALWAGYTYANVLAYLLAKGTTRPTLAGEALKDDIKRWLDMRDDVKRDGKAARVKSPKRQRGSDSVTPQAIADALSLDARQVRIRLRKLEAKIPKAWKMPEERWGFKKEHEADIVKLIAGGK